MFCSRSCSATFWNKHRNRKKVVFKNKCIECGNLTNNKKRCSNECRHIFYNKEYKKKVEKIELSGEVSIYLLEVTNRKIAKKYLIKKFGIKCWICGLFKWFGEVDILIVLDHIDGNAMNYKLENLRLVCGNCNMLLPTFAGGNVGKGTRSKKPHI